MILRLFLFSFLLNLWLCALPDYAQSESLSVDEEFKAFNGSEEKDFIKSERSREGIFRQALKEKGAIKFAIENALKGDYSPVGFYHHTYGLHAEALDCTEEYQGKLDEMVKQGAGHALLKISTYDEQTVPAMVYNWTLILMPDYPYQSLCKIKPLPSEDHLALIAWRNGLEPDEFKKAYEAIGEIENHILKSLNITKEEYGARRKKNAASNPQ